MNTSTQNHEMTTKVIAHQIIILTIQQMNQQNIQLVNLMMNLQMKQAMSSSDNSSILNLLFIYDFINMHI